MSIFLVKTRSAYKSEILKEMHESPSAKDVLDHLIGDNDGWVNSDYQLRKYDYCKNTVLQRINSFWVIPLYALLIAPLRWIFTGSTGMKTDSKGYAVLKYLIGDKW